MNKRYRIPKGDLGSEAEALLEQQRRLPLIRVTVRPVPSERL